MNFSKTLLLAAIIFLSSSCRPVRPIENPFLRQDVTTSGAQQPNASLQIFILNVGQGDSTLVMGPNGKSLLIDAGRPGEGVGVVLPALEEYGIDRLDWMIASHYDADHIGGLGEVLMGPDQVLGTQDDFPPQDAAIDRGDGTDKATSTYEDYIDLFRPYRREAAPGMILDLGAGATAEVVVVNGRFVDGRSILLDPDEENESCIGLLIRYGDFSYFTAGDLTGGGAPGGFETKDLETPAGEIIGDIDILHVGHHGSASSTNETFLAEIMPEAAVISVGKENDYGHPTEEVLSRLNSTGADIFRTDERGTIQIKTQGTGYTIAPSPLE